MNAQLTGGVHRLLYVIEEDHLVRLHTDALAGNLKDLTIGFPDPLFMRVNDEVVHIPEAVSLVLYTAGPGEAVADNSGLVARAKRHEVVRKLLIERAAILVPKVFHELF